MAGSKADAKAGDFDLLIKAAVEPRKPLPSGWTQAEGWLPSPISQLSFAVLYFQAPEFFCELLLKLRACWFKKSKQQKLQNFLCTESLVFLDKKNRFIFYCNKELRDHYNDTLKNKGRDVVTEKDVEAARRTLAKLQEQSRLIILRLEKAERQAKPKRKRRFRIEAQSQC